LWVTDHFRELISRKHQAFRRGEKEEYNRVRNIINRKSRVLKKNYYNQNLASEEDPNKLFEGIKKISGQKRNSNLQALANKICDGYLNNLAERINNFFQSICEDLPPLDPSYPKEDIVIPDKYIITTEDVLKNLLVLKSKKSPGPDGCYAIKYYADELSKPICSIFNSSLKQRYVPSQWRCANVSPLPKNAPPQEIETDIRPVSLTSIVSKTMEGFVCQCLLEASHDKIKKDQYGGLPGSSTTMALIEMLHDWYTWTDNPENYIRVVLIDFQKAFDCINHHILLQKLKDTNLPLFIIDWITSFLSCRKQRIKIGNTIQVGFRLKVEYRKELNWVSCYSCL
jgi:hypothetical protein